MKLKLGKRSRFLRKGVAAVETAVVAPLLVVSMLGMMEVGYAFLVRQTVTMASREGARAAALPGGTMDDVDTAVDAAMSAAGLVGYETDSNVSGLLPSDPEVWVSVTIPLNRVSFTGSLLGGGSFDIGSTTTMRREGIDDVDDD
ncbi:MAG: pilus assembly protein [Planctomycetes bacterium]|nr:pilus assembly protein [Planctomycetota bacterium]